MQVSAEFRPVRLFGLWTLELGLGPSRLRSGSRFPLGQEQRRPR